MSELSDWINELTGEYAEPWIGEQLAEVWQKDKDKIAELETKLAAYETENAAWKVREEMAFRTIAKLEAKLAAYERRLKHTHKECENCTATCIDTLGDGICENCGEDVWRWEKSHD